MKTKGLVIGSLILVCCVLGYATKRPHPEPKLASLPKPAPVVSTELVPPPPAPEASPGERPSPPPEPQIDPAPEPMPQTNLTSHKPAASTQAAKKPKKELKDPMARTALSLVGTDDLDAETYWLGAIFDSSLPDNEREDLMEDLNEEGFADPKHPAPEELPLIVNRLRMIEDVAPHADDFMQTHLAEAYKDLIILLNGKTPR